MYALRLKLLQTLCIGAWGIFFSLGNLYAQKTAIEKLKLQGVEYIYPTPKTLHYLITHIHDSIWQSHLLPLGFIEIGLEHKMVAFQFEKGSPGKIVQIVSFDNVYGIVSVFWQDPNKKYSLIEPIKKKLKSVPKLHSVYTTYELNMGGKKFWFSIRSQVKNGILEEEATLEYAR